MAINFNQMIKLWHSTKNQPMKLEEVFNSLIQDLKKHYKR